MNNLEKALVKIGTTFLAIFKDIDKAAVVAEPFVDIAFPVLAPVYNASANGAAAALSAGQAAYDPTKPGDQNLIAVTSAIEPVLASFASKGGLSAPTTATVMSYAQALIASGKLTATA